MAVLATLARLARTVNELHAGLLCLHGKQLLAVTVLAIRIFTLSVLELLAQGLLSVRRRSRRDFGRKGLFRFVFSLRLGLTLGLSSLLGLLEQVVIVAKRAILTGRVPAITGCEETAQGLGFVSGLAAAGITPGEAQRQLLAAIGQADALGALVLPDAGMQWAGALGADDAALRHEEAAAAVVQQGQRRRVVLRAATVFARVVEDTVVMHAAESA